MYCIIVLIGYHKKLLRRPLVQLYQSWVGDLITTHSLRQMASPSRFTQQERSIQSGLARNLDKTSWACVCVTIGNSQLMPAYVWVA